MSKVRMKLANDEFVDFSSDECDVTDWAMKLQYSDAVVRVAGKSDGENAGYEVFIPVRSIIAVEVSPEELPEI